MESGGLHHSKVLVYLINIMELKAIAVYVSNQQVINILKVYKED